MTIVGSISNTTAVFSFKIYDIAFDEFKVSSRYATAEAIVRFNAVRMGPPFDIPSEGIDSDGLTIKGYVLPMDR